MAYDVDGHSTDELLLYDVSSDSVATVHITPDTAATGKYPVRQLGPRRLWSEAEAAHTWWCGHQRPDPTRFGLTVVGAGQGVWLDEPDNVVRAWPAAVTSEPYGAAKLARNRGS